MAVSKPAPPADVVEALRSGIVRFFDLTDPLAVLLLEEAEAHEIFTLGLQDLGFLRDQIANHKSVGWRFLCTHPASDLACHVGGSGPVVTGVARGAQIRTILKSIFNLNELVRFSPDCKGVQDANYELRVLRIPALFMEALWLSNANDPTRDLIIPFLGFEEYTNSNATYQLQFLRPYPVNAFLDEIRAVAGHRLERQKELYPQDFADVANDRPAATRKKRGGPKPKPGHRKKS